MTVGQRRFQCYLHWTCSRYIGAVNSEGLWIVGAPGEVLPVENACAYWLTWTHAPVGACTEGGGLRAAPLCRMRACQHRSVCRRRRD
eukprot:6206521-Pleurochrysis_carterae.AAC.1